MAKCDYCSSTIIFGGLRTKEKNIRYCNDKCYHNAVLLAVSDQMPLELINQQIRMVHQGLCPKCKGSGPVDVHTKFQVWSALLVTSWSNTQQISCRQCGRKNQLIGIFSSLLFGWWGFPWGFIMTPVQVIRNIRGIVKGPDNLYPSQMLEKSVRLAMADLVDRSREKSAS